MTIKDFEYGPAEVTVAESGTVRFENAERPITPSPSTAAP